MAGLQFVEPSIEIIDSAEDLFGHGEHFAEFRCGRAEPCPTVEELHAEAPLDFGHALRERRLGDAQSSCCFRPRADPSRLANIEQLVDRQVGELSHGPSVAKTFLCCLRLPVYMV